MFVIVFGSGVLVMCVRFLWRLFVASSDHHNNNHHSNKPHLRAPPKPKLSLSDVNLTGLTSPEERFAVLRDTNAMSLLQSTLKEWRAETDRHVMQNLQLPHPRWIRPYLLPQTVEGRSSSETTTSGRQGSSDYFRVHRGHMAWNDAYKQLPQPIPGPIIDYTDPNKYRYPKLLKQPNNSLYPKLSTLKQLMDHWPQDEDNNGTIVETLLHFNYSNTKERAMAQRFRDAELPFKLYDIPELRTVATKWTDEYLSEQFDSGATPIWRRKSLPIKPAPGTAQESVDNFFAFFIPQHWKIDYHGLPPSRNNNFDFAVWAQHARYADAVQLSPHQPHFYWQCGVSAQERFQTMAEQTFVTRDLRLFSTQRENFFVFDMEKQKGIQVSLLFVVFCCGSVPHTLFPYRFLFGSSSAALGRGALLRPPTLMGDAT